VHLGVRAGGGARRRPQRFNIGTAAMMPWHHEIETAGRL